MPLSTQPQGKPAQRPLDPALAAVRGRFIETLPDRILRLEALKQMLQTGEYEAASVLASISGLTHKIAGVAETLGFLEIGRLSSLVDRHITQGTLAGTAPGRLWPEVSERLEQLLDEMEIQLDA